MSVLLSIYGLLERKSRIRALALDRLNKLAGVEAVVLTHYNWLERISGKKPVWRVWLFTESNFSDREYAAAVGLLLRSDVAVQLELVGKTVRSESLQSLVEVATSLHIDLSGLSDVRTVVLPLLSLPRCDRLDLEYTDCDDELVAEIVEKLRIKELNLAHTAVGDMACLHLKTASGLEVVNVSATAVTDKGLFLLVDNPSVHIVYAAGAKVTPEGKAKALAMREEGKHRPLTVALPQIP